VVPPAQDARVFVRCPRCLRLVICLDLHSLRCEVVPQQRTLDLGLPPTLDHRMTPATTLDHR